MSTLYKQLALKQAIGDLAQVQYILAKITDEPEITAASEKIKEAIAKLAEAEKDVSDHLEEHR